MRVRLPPSAPLRPHVGMTAGRYERLSGGSSPSGGTMGGCGVKAASESATLKERVRFSSSAPASRWLVVQQDRARAFEAHDGSSNLPRPTIALLDGASVRLLHATLRVRILPGRPDRDVAQLAERHPLNVEDERSNRSVPAIAPRRNRMPGRFLNDMLPVRVRSGRPFVGA